MHRSLAVASAALLCAATLSAHAQTIYPLDKAEILAGAKFDLKVEFPGAPAQSAVRVTINGEDAAARPRPARQLRRARGRRRLIRPTGSAASRWPSPAPTRSRLSPATRSARVNWEVFDTDGSPKAKNVILFIGDGLSVAHRTAARVLSKGLVRRPLRRRARDRRHAAHGAGLDLGHRLDRHRQRQQHERLHHRPQVLRQRHGRLLRAQQEQPRSPEGRDHLRAGQARAAAWRSASSPTPRSRTRRRPPWWRTRAAAPTTTTS